MDNLNPTWGEGRGETFIMKVPTAQQPAHINGPDYFKVSVSFIPVRTY